MRIGSYTISVVLVILMVNGLHAQVSVHDGSGTDPNASSMLDVQSTAAGVLIPRMTEAQRNDIISPANSLLIYQTNSTPGYYYYDLPNTTWRRLFAGSGSPVTGSGTATRVAFWTAGNELGSNAALYWDNGNGRLGIGTEAPRGSLNISRDNSVASADISSYPLTLSYPSDDNSGETGIAFRISSNQTADRTPGAAITHRRTGGNSQGHLYFKTAATHGGTTLPTTKMVIQGDGNVGIGTVGPDATLHVMGEGRMETDNGLIRVTPTGWRSPSRSQLLIHSKADQPAEIDLSHTDGGVDYGWHFSARGSGENRDLRIYRRQDLSFTHLLTVNYADGNVGIGPSTANPTARLHVNGSVRFQSLTNGFLQADANGNLSIATGSGLFTSGNGLSWAGTTLNSVWTSNGNHIHNNNSANVGVGTTTPTELLNVNEGAIAVDRTSSGTLNQMLYLRNNQTGNNTGAAIDFGFSTAVDYYHAGIRAYRTNEGGGHASRIELLARRAASGTGDSFLTPLVTAKYSGTSPFVLLDGDVGIRVTGNPTARLHTTGTVRFEGLTNGFLLADGNGNLSTANGSGLFTSGNGLTWSGTTLNSVWTSNGTHIHNNNSGNVGIGLTTDPPDRLTVNGAARFLGTAGQTRYNFITQGSGNGDWSQINLNVGGNMDAGGLGGGYFIYYGDGRLRVWNRANNHLAFGTDNSERMRIKEDGNVGIGATNPLAMLHIEGNNGTDVFRVRTSNGSGNATNIMRLMSASDAGLTGTQWDFAWLIETGGNPRDLWFKANSGTVRMRSDHIWLDETLRVNGNVGIGTAPSGTYKLMVNGNIRSNAINETSDVRLKRNINGIGDALAKVLEMNGVTYEWRTDDFPEREFREGLQYGLIAQQLEEVVPELVDTDEEGWKSIEYSHIVPLLIEAMKEQQATIDRQNQMIDEHERSLHEVHILRQEVEEFRTVLHKFQVLSIDSDSVQ